ncbi:MAG: hypothetical protein ACHP7N_03080 [Caulobacterales bacterium]
MTPTSPSPGVSATGGPSRARQIVVAVAAAIALAISGAAHAQGFSPVGQWSHSQQYSNGGTAYVIVLTLYPNGQLQEYLTTNMGATTYVGQWRYDPQSSQLDMIYNDYNPKQMCGAGVCYASPPTLRLGVAYSVPMRVLSYNQIELADASGPMLYIRQQ